MDSRPARAGGVPAPREPGRLRPQRAGAARRAHGRARLRRAGLRRHRPRPGPRRRPALPRLRDVGIGPHGRHVHGAAQRAQRALRAARGRDLAQQALHQLRRLVGRRPPARAARRHRRLQVGLDGGRSPIPVLSPAGLASNNGTKANPALSADILGDWREEVVWREADNGALRIYTTTIPTPHRLYTLMHDRQYRSADRLAADRVQPAAPSRLLPGRRHGPAPDSQHRDLAGHAAGAGRARVHRASPTTPAPPPPTSSPPIRPSSSRGTAPPETTVTVTRLGVGVIGTAAGGRRRPVEPRLHGGGPAGGDVQLRRRLARRRRHDRTALSAVRA